MGDQTPLLPGTDTQAPTDEPSSPALPAFFEQQHPLNLPQPPPLPVPPPLSSSAAAGTPDDFQIDLATPGISRTQKHRLGRRSRFSNSDDLILIREVAAAKAHLAPNGSTRERFEIAASKSNATKRLSQAVTWKAVQDRYKRLQERFDKYDKMESKMSGVGGDVGEAEELLSGMREARMDFETERDNRKQKVREKEERKERLGAIIRERATKRLRGDDEACVAVDVDTDHASVSDIVQKTAPGAAGSFAPSTGRKRRASAAAFVAIEDETAAFTEALEKGDAKRHELEMQRLALERQRFEAELDERKRDREERREERDAAQKLDLEKFLILMEMLAKTGQRLQGPDSAEHR